MLSEKIVNRNPGRKSVIMKKNRAIKPSICKAYVFENGGPFKQQARECKRSVPHVSDTANHSHLLSNFYKAWAIAILRV